MSDDSRHVTVRMSESLYDTIKHRSRMNNRSLTGEINFLIETGLGAQSETTREMIHFLYKTTELAAVND